MKYGMYVFFDRVSGTYGEPFLAANEPVAVRRFQYVMQNAPMVAQDSQLYCVGSYDTDKGIVTANEKPVFVCNYVAEAKE
ncbi:nonstructural protein [Microvirus mar3]|uniref:Nonstructural protein n=1 Tax=Microvirus mar3 TaxID=2851163 RepID=A0A8F5MLD4_9VIRU|nr:nonstructural protein [Microvirus mar3]